MQRLPIPHTFNDGLPLPEAALAVAGAVIRILCGCVLFALWALLGAWLWTAIPSYYLRWLVLVPVLVLFLSSLLAAMIGISAIAKAFKRSPHIR